MTPQELAKNHIINILELDDDETINYHFIPDYKTPCKKQDYYVAYDKDVEEYYWDKLDEVPMDSEERDWFTTEKEAWIACAKENHIYPEYQQVYDHFVVTKWLYDQLVTENEQTSNYKGCFIWGRTCSGQTCYMDRVIKKIAKNN